MNIMKNKFSLWATLLIITCLQNALSLPFQYLYILKIRLPPAITNTSNVIGYYHGKELRLNAGCIPIPEKQERLAFSVIITPEVEHKAIKNNIWYLKRLPTLPCRWFDLTLSFEQGENGKLVYRWAIEEQNIDKVSLRLPDHTILIQTDPKLIDKLENPTEGNDSRKLCSGINTQSTIIYFPTIVFKKNISKQEFEDALVYPSLAALDTRAIHEDID